MSTGALMIESPPNKPHLKQDAVAGWPPGVCCRAFNLRIKNKYLHSNESRNDT
jgi:hypothetical protein